VTDRLTVPWPDASLFAERDGRPLRILAVSDEPDPSLEARATRDALGQVDVVVGAGDLQPDYLAFVADAFDAPLHYVRGNHDVGAAWVQAEGTLLPGPMPEGAIVTEGGLGLIGFSGSPVYSHRGHEVGATTMLRRAFVGWMRARSSGPLIVVSHAPPRGLNDASDPTHRGFAAFRWLVDRLAPPIWLHGHTALVRRGLDARCTRHGPTLLYNCTGATLVELVPVDSRPVSHG
jgi:Icc-related predicted phosphoesterase